MFGSPYIHLYADDSTLCAYSSSPAKAMSTIQSAFITAESQNQNSIFHLPAIHTHKINTEPDILQYCALYKCNELQST